MKKIMATTSMVMVGIWNCANADQRINYLMVPKSFNFKMFSVEKAKTDCNNLNRLVQSFRDKSCLGSNKSTMCDVLLTQLKAEMSIDRQNLDRIGPFSRGYLVKTFENLDTPTEYSKRFDQAYADGYSFGLNDVAGSGQVEYQSKMSSEELAIEYALQLKKDISFEKNSESGGVALVVKSKIRVCAIESGKLELIFTVPMSISTYHPIGDVAYQIAEEVYQKGVEISSHKDMTDNQKNYLLGLAAGSSLKKMDGKIVDSKELAEIALSLQKVILKNVDQGFDPVEVGSSSSVGVRLLDPGIVIKDAKANVAFGGVWRE